MHLGNTYQSIDARIGEDLLPSEISPENPRCTFWYARMQTLLYRHYRCSNLYKIESLPSCDLKTIGILDIQTFWFFESRSGTDSEV